MNKGHMAYFEKDDVLHFAISQEAEAGSVEVSPNITVEVNEKGEMIAENIPASMCYHLYVMVMELNRSARKLKHKRFA